VGEDDALALAAAEAAKLADESTQRLLAMELDLEKALAETKQLQAAALEAKETYEASLQVMEPEVAAPAAEPAAPADIAAAAIASAKAKGEKAIEMALAEESAAAPMAPPMPMGPPVAPPTEGYGPNTDVWAPNGQVSKAPAATTQKKGFDAKSNAKVVDQSILDTPLSERGTSEWTTSVPVRPASLGKTGKNMAPERAWYQKAIPFADAPRLLDGSIAGDSAFDPAGFVNSKVELFAFREAEIKHCRLAMLAAAGWPLAELWDTGIANTIGLPSVIEANNGLNPAVLNGGLGLVSPVYWVAVLGIAAAMEFKGQSIKDERQSSDPSWMLTNSWTPGDLGFDPLGLYNAFGAQTAARRAMETAEIKNGRLAMLAITIFAVEEFVTKRPVIEITPLLFTPFPKVVEQLMIQAPALY